MLSLPFLHTSFAKSLPSQKTCVLLYIRDKAAQTSHTASSLVISRRTEKVDTIRYGDNDIRKVRTFSRRCSHFEQPRSDRVISLLPAEAIVYHHNKSLPSSYYDFIRIP